MAAENVEAMTSAAAFADASYGALLRERAKSDNTVDAVAARRDQAGTDSEDGAAATNAMLRERESCENAAVAVPAEREEAVSVSADWVAAEKAKQVEEVVRKKVMSKLLR